jgi:carbon storage regulator
MLLLTRRIDQTICIGPDIRVTVTRIRGYQITLGIEAPLNVNIWREELEQRAERDDIEELDTVARRCERP